MQPPANTSSTSQDMAVEEAILVTHEAPAPATGGSPGAALIGQLPLLAAIVAIFYFLVIRPQNQERKRHEQLIGSLKKDDDIVTQSGLYGRVTRVDGQRIEIEVAPKVRLWTEASSIKRRQADESASADDAKKGG